MMNLKNAPCTNTGSGYKFLNMHIVQFTYKNIGYNKESVIQY